MATDDQQVLVTGTAATPTHFTIPGNGQIQPKAIFAHFDGASAATAFQPALKIISDGGEVVAICPCLTSVAAAGSADVSWFPRVGSQPPAGIPAGGVTLEQFFVDSTSAGVTSSTVLVAGDPYLITVQGTYSLWNAALDQGTPNADAMFPGSLAGRVSTEVGLDPDVEFAATASSGTWPRHTNQFEMNLGGGYVHVEPDGGPYATPQPNYLYKYSVTGQGSAVSFRVNDAPINDNYGKLQVTIQGFSGGSSGGGGSGSLLPPSGSDHSILRVESGVPVWEARPDIVEADLSLSNVTTGNVSTSRHGFAPIAPNDATKFLDGTGAYSVPAGGSGTISDITSTGSTITVTAPTGPTTNVDLPASGVTGGTYGSSTQVAQVVVNAEGIVTGASNVSISGISGTGLVKLFDSTLNATAAAIDTGANGVAGGHGDLIIMYIARTNRAANQDNVGFTFNNDSAAHYDTAELIGGLNGAGVVSSVLTNARSAIFGYCTGASATASYPGSGRLSIPSYDQTTFNKTVELAGGWPSQLGSGVAYVTAQVVGVWRSTAAITRIAMTGTVGSLVAGSRLVIYGTQ